MNEIARRPDPGARRVPVYPTRDALGSFIGRTGPDEITVPEPPIGAVIRYSIDHGGRLYTYVSMRADNGLWYTTGGGSKQSATWSELTTALKKRLSGPVELLIPHSTIWRA